MLYFLVVINTFLFIAIALIHFYWAFGGKWGMDKVIPTSTENNKLTFKPGPVATIIVAFGMLFFAGIMLTKAGFFTGIISEQWPSYATIAIGGIFLLRAIGDFKYVGFTKKVKGTNFANNDTKYFSPLCVLIGLISMLIVALG